MATLSYFDDYFLSDDDKKAILTLKSQVSADPTNIQSYNRMAEDIRAKYNYSGGADGSKYIPITPKPVMPKIEAYNSPYSKQLDGAISDIESYDPFSWNADTDTSFQAFLSKATRMGDTAFADNLAGLSAGTGGRENSWAASVASQSRNNYMLQAAEAMPQFEQNAYARWQSGLQMLYQKAEMYQGLDETQYNRYRDTINDTFKRFDYELSQYRDTITDKQTAISNAYERTRLLGYVSNEDAVVLGVAPGTPSFEVQERKAAMDEWLEQQKKSLEFYEEQLKIDKKNAVGDFKPRSSGTGGSKGGDDFTPTQVSSQRDKWVKAFEDDIDPDLDTEDLANAISDYLDKLENDVNSGAISPDAYDQIISAIEKTVAWQRLNNLSQFIDDEKGLRQDIIKNPFGF